MVVAFGLVVADWMDPVSGRPSLIVLAIVLAFSFLYYPLVLRRRRKVKPPVPAPDAADA